MDRIIRIGWKAVAALMLAFVLLAAAGQAKAATPDDPATRSYAARIIVERALLADIPNRDRGGLWQGTECMGDGHLVSFTQRRRICYLSALGIMGDTGRNAAYPTFEPNATITRGQMASIVWRLASQERTVLPAHAAVFIDVRRGSTHEPAIRFGAYHGLIRGYPGQPATFRPDDPVTRRQVRTLVARVVDHWRHGAVQ